jgi:adenine deaminase
MSPKNLDLNSRLKRLKRLIDVASGRKRAELVLKDAELVNVLTEEIYPADIAISDNLIAGVGNYSGIKEIDCRDFFAVPGLIDGHTHIEMSMLTLTEFARIVVPRGNTAVIADPHEIANVLGVDGVKLMIDEAKYIPIRFFCMAPSCVPSSNLETGGAVITDREIEELLSMEEVIGVAEVMRFSDVVSGNEEFLKKILVSGKVDGHAPFLSGKALNAYISAGIQTDHESVSFEEAREKLRLGMKIMVREGSVAKNLKDLIELVKKGNRNVMLVTDGDRNLNDLIKKGYLDYVYRKAVKEGIDAIKALQMCTVNPAEHYGLNIGSITPGKFADIVILSDLENFKVERVIFNGKILDGGDFHRRYQYPEKAKNTIKARKISKEDIKLDPKDGKKTRVIKLIEGELLTDELIVEKISDSINKIVVLERHKGTNRIGKGFVYGFGIKSGAIASTIAHDSHNIIAVGDANDDDYIVKAVNRLIELQGGIVVVNKNGVFELQLEIAGLMTEKSTDEVMKKLRLIHQQLEEMGCKLEAPIIALSFLALPVIPKLKITDYGLVDVGRQEVVDVFVD